MTDFVLKTGSLVGDSDALYSSADQLRHAGVVFNALDADTFTNWIAQSLFTPSNQTIIFTDAIALNHIGKDKLAFEMLRHADLVIPKGRGLKLMLKQTAASHANAAPSEQLYQELLSEIEHRTLKVSFLVSKVSHASRLENLFAQLYPSLEYEIIIIDNAYRFSTNELAAQLERVDTRVVISCLPSPIQERMLSRLNRHLHNQLLIGAGEGFIGSLEELPNKARNKLHKFLSALRRRRQSILLRPHHWLSYLSRWLENIFNRTENHKGLNASLTRNGWQTRLLRLSIALKAWSFRSRRHLSYFIKRLLDLLGVGTGLLMLLPLLIGVGLIIKFSSPGPIFYSQIRVGLRGKTFRMWKFRSMYTDADKRKAELEAQNEMAGGVLFKMKKDPRITPIGRIIRRLSIDELPQLFNVLTGEMSLVGPRPALPKEVAEYPVLARARLEVKPGLTGLWQISGRSDLPFDKQVLLDTAYVHTQSTSNDIKLIAKTIPAVIGGKGAY